MKIEDYWDDRTAYFVSFLTQEESKIERILFLPSDMNDKNEIEQLIYSNFNRVMKVLSIDEWGGGLLLKEEEVFQ